MPVWEESIHGRPSGSDDSGSRDPMAQAFDDLPESRRAEYIRRAHANSGLCFLCRWIANEDPCIGDDGKMIFPMDARRVHLMLHCGS